MSALDALLVDLDGTLVDTAGANFAAYRAALAERGIPLGRAHFDRHMFGRNWRDFLPELLGDELSAAAPEIAARKAVIYPTTLGETRLNGPLVRLLRRFRGVVPIALVSSASRANIDVVLDHHALATLFDLVVSGNDVRHHKPDPEAYFLAATKLGVRPQSCLVIEDSDIGVAAGQAFGARVLRVAF